MCRHGYGHTLLFHHSSSRSYVVGASWTELSESLSIFAFPPCGLLRTWGASHYKSFLGQLGDAGVGGSKCDRYVSSLTLFPAVTSCLSHASELCLSCASGGYVHSRYEFYQTLFPSASYFISRNYVLCLSCDLVANLPLVVPSERFFDKLLILFAICDSLSLSAINCREAGSLWLAALVVRGRNLFISRNCPGNWERWHAQIYVTPCSFSRTITLQVETSPPRFSGFGSEKTFGRTTFRRRPILRPLGKNAPVDRPGSI